MHIKSSLRSFSKKKLVLRCTTVVIFFPACQPAVTLNKPLLNSRTFNIAIETSSCTCALHRFIRLEERSLIAKISWNGPRQRPLAALSRATSGSIQKPKADPYHFAGSASDSEPSSSWVRPLLVLVSYLMTDMLGPSLSSGYAVFIRIHSPTRASPPRRVLPRISAPSRSLGRVIGVRAFLTPTRS